jgi:YVTN family beta-propeller protein
VGGTRSSVASRIRIRAAAVIAAAAFLFVTGAVGIVYSADMPLALILVGRGPVAVAADPVTHRVFVANYSGGTVSVIDGVSNAVTSTVAMPTWWFFAPRPSAVVIDALSSPPRAYVANTGSQRISVIDDAAGFTTATVNVYHSLTSGPRSLALDPTSSPPKLYAASYGAGVVDVIDTSRNAYVKSIAVNGPYPSALGIYSSPTRKRVFVANRSTNTVSIIDGATDTRIADVPVGASPRCIAVDPDTGFAYVTNESSGNVTVIDDSDQVTATVQVGSHPIGIAIDRGGHRAFVANSYGNSVSVIRTTDFSVEAVLPSGPGPFAVTFDAGAGKAYVTNYGGSTVTVIDASLNHLGVPTGPLPHAIAVDEGLTPHRAYAVSRCSESVTVIGETVPLALSVFSPANAGAAAAAPILLRPDVQPGGALDLERPTITGSASSTRAPRRSGIVGVYYRLDGEKAWSRARITAGAGTPDATWTIAPQTRLTLGRHTVEIAAMDSASAVSCNSDMGSGTSGTALSTLVRLDVTIAAGDVIPPVTRAALTGIPGDNGWYRSAVTVELSATDEGAPGVARSEYSLDGGATWRSYDGPIVIETQGTAEVAYRSIDRAGNVESPKSLTLKIDSIPPAVHVDSPAAGGGYLLHSSLVASWTAADAGSGLTGPALASVANGAEIGTGVPGHALFEVVARDLAGNTTTVSIGYSIVYGKDLSGIPPFGTYSRSRTLPLRCLLFDAFGTPVAGRTVKLEVAPVRGDGTTGPRMAAPAAPFKAGPGGRYQTELRLKQLAGERWVAFVEFDDGTEATSLIDLK